MISGVTGWRAALPISAFLLLAGALPSGAQPPARNANIWNGHAHQPTRNNVLPRERSAGVAASPQRRANETATLDRLSHRLGGGHVRPPSAAHPAQEGQAAR